MDGLTRRNKENSSSEGSRKAWFAPSIIALSVALVGCVDVKNYATEAKGDAVLHKLERSRERDGWDFYTSLLNEENVYIELKHLGEDALYRVENNFVTIRLRISDSGKIEVLPLTFSVEVFDLDGNEIDQAAPPRRTLVFDTPIDETSGRTRQTWHFVFTFPARLPETVTERVRFDLKADRELRSYNYTFSVMKRLEYTYNPLLDI